MHLQSSHSREYRLPGKAWLSREYRLNGKAWRLVLASPGKPQG